jgi:hypothetical protein
MGRSHPTPHQIAWQIVDLNPASEQSHPEVIVLEARTGSIIAYGKHSGSFKAYGWMIDRISPTAESADLFASTRNLAYPNRLSRDTGEFSYLATQNRQPGPLHHRLHLKPASI